MIWRVSSRSPRPAPSTPALLETKVRFFTPVSRMAWIRVSGMPQKAEAAGHDQHAVLQHAGERRRASGKTFFMPAPLFARMWITGWRKGQEPMRKAHCSLRSAAMIQSIATGHWTTGRPKRAQARRQTRLGLRNFLAATSAIARMPIKLPRRIKGRPIRRGNPLSRRWWRAAWIAGSEQRWRRIIPTAPSRW